LLEEAIYDRDSGQLVTGSFTDYAMPRADSMPNIGGALHGVPATTNVLGVKGAGEAGTTGALAVIMNAIADALPGDAGADLDMPATPYKIWRPATGPIRSFERRYRSCPCACPALASQRRSYAPMRPGPRYFL
jgi:aerobic carbon-monoxide dehydrogenase large subunit